MSSTCESLQTRSFTESFSVRDWLKAFGKSAISCIWPIHSAYDVLRILLAFFLLIAAILKAYELATEPVIGKGFLDSRWLLILGVEFELFFAPLLLANVCPKQTWVAALGLFTLFMGISLYKALSGYASCGCFGPVKVNPWYTTALDLSIVISLLYWRPRGLRSLFSVNVILSEGKYLLRGEGGSFPLPTARATAVLLAWFILAAPATYAMSSYTDTTLSEAGEIIGDGKIVVLEPETWIGKRFPLLPFIEDVPGTSKQDKRPLRERLAEGDWIVILYHHECPKCQKKMPEYIKLASRAARDSTAPQVALIEIPPFADVNTLSMPRDGGCFFGRLSDGKKWFVETPVEMLVQTARLIPTTDRTVGHGSSKSDNELAK